MINPQALLARLPDLLASLDRQAALRPVLAWGLALTLVLGLAGYNASYWVLADYPQAMWHHTPRGDDIEIIQANAAKAGWKELGSYWTGDWIAQNGFYRPATSWMMVLQYRLFGREDRDWQSVSVALHLLVTLTLVWTTFVLLDGSFLGRLSTSVLAGIFFAAPRFADQAVLYWILGWWPCQSDHFALVAALALLASVVQYTRSPSRRRGAVCLALFALGLAFKEATYVVGLGACLMLLRRRCWPLLSLMALEGVVLFAFRIWALHGRSYPLEAPLPRTVGMSLWPALGLWSWVPGTVLVLGMPLWLSAAAAWGLRRRRASPGAAAVGAVVTYLGVIHLLYGELLDPNVRDLVYQHAVAVTHGLMLWGLVLAQRRWPFPELAFMSLVTVVLVGGFPMTFAHYQYWPAAFGSILAAVAFATLARHLWDQQLAAARTAAQPSSSSR